MRGFDWLQTVSREDFVSPALCVYIVAVCIVCVLRTVCVCVCACACTMYIVCGAHDGLFNADITASCRNGYVLKDQFLLVLLCA